MNKFDSDATGYCDSLFMPLIRRTLELLTENHCFRLELKNADRNINKKAWKEISRWLRITRNRIEKRIDYSQLAKHTRDLVIFGYSEMKIE